ncbi:MAG TPA: hypothetical protein VN673_06905 [Clostridia bacterium]|nr:hypothetical protein [Clostridia bacterium]
MKIRKSILGILILIAICLLAILVAVFQKRTQTLAHEKRVANVAALSGEFAEARRSGLQPDVNSLFEGLAKKGVILKFSDRQKAEPGDYKLLLRGRQASEANADEVIIEETERVANDGYVVRAYVDGSIKLERKQQ